MNLALPVEVLPPLLKRARENPDPPIEEQAKRAFLGVTRTENAGNCRIFAVSPDSAADKAGLKAADVIIKADDQKIESFEDLVDFLADKRAGEVVTLKVRRTDEENDDKEIEIEVTLGERPE